MPQPRPRGPAERPAAGPLKQNATKDTKSKSLFAIKKGGKKDSDLKKVAGEDVRAKGPHSHSKS